MRLVTDEMLQLEEAKKLHLENNASRIYTRLHTSSKATLDRTDIISSH